AVWLIDHGATLYAHHAPGWTSDRARARDPFPMIRDHVLLRRATRLEAIDDELTARLTPDVIAGIVGLIPTAWLEDPVAAGPAARADDYGRYLTDRLTGPRPFVEEAVRVR